MFKNPLTNHETILSKFFPRQSRLWPQRQPVGVDASEV